MYQSWKVLKIHKTIRRSFSQKQNVKSISIFAEFSLYHLFIVPMPNLFRRYNANMGRVDLFDQFVSTCRVRICSKKGCWSFYAWSINTTVVTARRLLRKIPGNNIPLLKFLRELALETLEKYGRNRPTQSLNTSRIAGTSIKLDTLFMWLWKANRNIADVNSVEEGPFWNAKYLTSVCTQNVWNHTISKREHALCMLFYTFINPTVTQ